MADRALIYTPCPCVDWIDCWLRRLRVRVSVGLDHSHEVEFHPNLLAGLTEQHAEGGEYLFRRESAVNHLCCILHARCPLARCTESGSPWNFNFSESGISIKPLILWYGQLVWTGPSARKFLF